MLDKTRFILIVIFAVSLRWSVTYHPYSGEGIPPMFGDYEAQRHWQEITFSLPYDEWYSNSTNNDLQYWGLDYPPLTAYHSWILGHVANKMNPSFVVLGSSRGFESDDHKFFMRLTVLVADLTIYIPAVICFVLKSKIEERAATTSSKNDTTNFLSLKETQRFLISTLIYPGLILIDYGHFQYNCVSLGLFVAAVTSILGGRELLGSSFFVAALNYKQMELYHSLPFFFYILGSSLSYTRRKGLDIRLGKLARVALIVLISFTIVWSPFLTRFDTLFKVLERLFPIGRGIFEDKVANVWCAVNVVYKLREAFTDLDLAKICLIATLAFVLPSNLHLFLKPTREKFLISLINTSLAFFLFSFQVHEKSILLVAVPVLLYTREDPLPCFWFLIVSNFSMSHLYVKDNLIIAYVAITTFYLVSVYSMFPELFYPFAKQWESNDGVEVSKSKGVVKSLNKPRFNIENKEKKNRYHFLAVRSFYLSILGMIFLTCGMFTVKPPRKYPDLFPVLISLYSCAHFVIFFTYFNYKQFMSFYYRNEKLKSM